MHILAGIETECTQRDYNILLSTPRLSSETKVKDWNIAAQSNNRVTVKLKPADFDVILELEQDYYK